MPVLRTFTVCEDFESWKTKNMNGGVHTVFLAGPIERVGVGSDERKVIPKWRDQALLLLTASRPDLVVFNPEWAEKPRDWTYEKQVMWEVDFLRRAYTIMFWIPRTIPLLPAFTTNIEVGEWLHADNIVIGAPPLAVNMRYIRLRCEMRNLPWHDTLESCCAAVVARAERGWS